jgi:hypothetical protein
VAAGLGGSARVPALATIERIGFRVNTAFTTADLPEFRAVGPTVVAVFVAGVVDARALATGEAITDARVAAGAAMLRFAGAMRVVEAPHEKDAGATATFPVWRASSTAIAAVVSVCLKVDARTAAELLPRGANAVAEKALGAALRDSSSVRDAITVVATLLAPGDAEIGYVATALSARARRIADGIGHAFAVNAGLVCAASLVREADSATAIRVTALLFVTGGGAGVIDAESRFFAGLARLASLVGDARTATAIAIATVLARAARSTALRAVFLSLLLPPGRGLRLLAKERRQHGAPSR